MEAEALARAEARGMKPVVPAPGTVRRGVWRVPLLLALSSVVGLLFALLTTISGTFCPGLPSARPSP